MELKGRLKLVADMVPDCDIVCDIGTDHAYIPIFLIEHGRCKAAIAADVRPGPIEKARRNITKYKMDGRIGTRIGDGLEPLNEDEADTIVIAGMGGLLITRILSEGIPKAQKAKRLILQPMSAVEEVREWLYQNGFKILNEGLVSERDKIYNAISAKWTGEIEEYNLTDIHIGRKLIDKNEPLLKTFVKKRINQLNIVLKGIEKSNNIREYEFEQTKSLMNEFIKLYKNLQRNRQ